VSNITRLLAVLAKNPTSC